MAVLGLAAVAAVAHLGVGFLMAVSGLAVPIYVVAILLLEWAALTVLLLRLVQRRSWWTPAVLAVGIASWFVILSVGSAVFGLDRPRTTAGMDPRIEEASRAVRDSIQWM